jgi:hypothetical protein
MDMEMNGDDEEEKDKEEQNQEEENEDDDEDEEEDEDEGKDPSTIGQGEMVNTLADDVHIMVDNHPTRQPEQGQEMHKHTAGPQLPASAPQPQTPEPHPQTQTPETHPLSWQEFLGHLMLQIPSPAMPTLKEANSAGTTVNFDVERQLHGESAGSNSLPNVSFHDVPLSDIPLCNVPPCDVPISDVPCPDDSLPEAYPDGSVDAK